MTAIVKNSVLNPLATSFVPSYMKGFNGDSATFKVKTIAKDLKADENSNHVKSKRRPIHHLGTTEIVRIKKFFYDKKNGGKFGNKLETKRLKFPCGNRTVAELSDKKIEAKKTESLCSKVIDEGLSDEKLEAKNTESIYSKVIDEGLSDEKLEAKKTESLCSKVIVEELHDEKLKVKTSESPFSKVVVEELSSKKLEAKTPGSFFSKVIVEELSDEKLEAKTPESLCSKVVIDEKLEKIKLKDSAIMPLCQNGNSTVFYKTRAVGITSLILIVMVDWLMAIASELFRNESMISSQVSKTPTIESSEDEKCKCPPMFGWIIPPTFFGNPLNIKYECSKNYVHSPKYGRKSIRTDKSLQKLEQYSLELEMIIRDVCDSIGELDENEFENYSEFSDKPQNESFKENEKTIWNNSVAVEIASDEEIVDDGDHPLLHSMMSKNGNEGSIKVVQDLLGYSLIPDNELEHFDNEPPPKVICDPPCSVWCDYLPSDAKDAFKRFIKSRQPADSNVDIARKTIERPSYKRSFSEGDVPMYTNPNSDFLSFTTEEERREKLIFLRKDPIAFFRSRPSTSYEERRASLSDLSNCQPREKCQSTQSHETSWGPFDGVDSLWQPLPDVIPANDCIQKSNRKVREMRRQRSVN